jgi:hypothetical protein
MKFYCRLNTEIKVLIVVSGAAILAVAAIKPTIANIVI